MSRELEGQVAVVTGATSGLGRRFAEGMAEPFPRKRLGAPEQLDSTLLYLCSPASELVTGTVIQADDGQFGR